MKPRLSGLILFMVLVITNARAENTTFEFDGPEQEQRFQALTSELRCLVCQNQSLADSHADLAGDLRREVHRLLREGKKDNDIIEFMTQRYGEFVLYRPRLNLSTLVLWFGPLAILLIGGWRLVGSIRHRSEIAAAPLSPVEQRKVADLLTPASQSTRIDRNN